MSISSIQQIATDAIAKADSIARDTRFANTHKETEVAATTKRALDMLAEKTTAEITRLESQLADLTQQSRVPFAPKAEDATALLYIRDAIEARFAGKKGGEFVGQMFKEWGAALSQGDTLTARVYRDFMPRFVISVGVTGTPVDYDKFVERTNHLLATPAQRDAAQALAETQTALDAFSKASNESRLKLESLKFRDGKIIEDWSHVLGTRRNY